MPEIRALPAPGGGTRNYGLPFVLDGIEKEVSIRIEGLSRNLVEDLPDLSLDLLEIAALVYGCDAAVSRGGPVDTQLGRAWYRDFRIEIPVRCQNLWTRKDVRAALSEVLNFVSGDQFKFSFTAHPGAGGHQGFFKFSPDDGWQADRVMMFSGGLDSFAGALEEMFEQKQQVALGSHFSATKIAPRQKALKAALESRCGPKSCKHCCGEMKSAPS